MSLNQLRADDFEGLRLDKDGTWLVEFGAEWCPPCRMLEPILEKMAKDHAGKISFAQVDGDTEVELASRFGVRGLPTLLLFKDGTVVGQRVGAAKREVLESWITG